MGNDAAQERLIDMTKSPITIRNDEELTAALARADEFAGCTPGSDDEKELAEIADAINVYTDSMRVLRMVDANPNQTDPVAPKE